MAEKAEGIMQLKGNQHCQQILISFSTIKHY